MFVLNLIDKVVCCTNC